MKVFGICLCFRGWWRPMFLTAGISSAKYFFHHVLRKNTITQAGSNELFSLFMDETMQYSCAIFKDRIRFLLCDYRQLPDTFKYDRIISCEAIEHVGHEYYEEFFRCCESALADDGIFVLQFSSVLEEKYDEFRWSPGFVKEYIFPRGNLPSLSILTSAMAASSRLCVDHVEEIGAHYHPTLRCWRANFLKNRSKILALGFNQEFIRSWECCLDSIAAGFKTELLLNYQVLIV
ncbi:hypothetical protein L1987_16357 [Smallanthus sonchifolius]|uniref:Uncharacterized protein n=1 Tax=Smallanthus sonchifolius TaxID=185202 RepID=A0ACB9J801_9ASTR|nr:hypothetical protein L1987_16357 [Smallanthus sonchifolius]